MNYEQQIAQLIFKEIQDEDFFTRVVPIVLMEERVKWILKNCYENET